jgi:excisionase family DNA binding protein
LTTSSVSAPEETTADLTTADVCRILNISDATVATWIRKGLMPLPFRCGNVRRWNRAAFFRWLESQKEAVRHE